jgi:hypothetical protein
MTHPNISQCTANLNIIGLARPRFIALRDSGRFFDTPPADSI